jgi:hypothetical protein
MKQRSKTSKKLVLKKLSLRNLNHQQMAQIQGGSLNGDQSQFCHNDGLSALRTCPLAKSIGC